LCRIALLGARAAGSGHEVRLIPPQYVKPYVKTNKNDATDAEAISEALTRPTMRFTAVKSAEQQSVLMLHRTRELLVRQRTMLVNALRGHCGEFGIVAAQGLSRAGDLIKRIEDPADTALPDLARQALRCLTSRIRAIQEQIALIEKQLLAWHSSCQASRRLAEIPGVGLITATAVVASVGNATQFRSARQFAAWLGLVPQQHSSGGKERLGHISKRGDGYIRRLLVHGARAHLSWSRRNKQIRSAWLTGLLARRPTNVVLLAMANKTARIAWAMLSRGERYQPRIAAAA
jgi:transposase